VPVVVTLAVLAPAYGSLRALDPTLLATALRRLHPEWLAVAAALTVGNIAVMGAYDVIGFRYTRASWRRRWFNGSVAFTWSNFLTLGPVAGPSVRFWLYRDSVHESASLRDGVVLISVAFGSGLAGWSMSAWVTRYAQVADRAWSLPVIAFACTVAAVFTVVGALRRLRMVGSEVTNESAAATAALGWLDWGLAWSAFAACLLAADAGAAIPGSVKVFFLGQSVGLVSLVPGGLGASDAWWVLHLDGSAPGIVSAVLAYRVLYYLLPWALGSVAMFTTAAERRRQITPIPAPDPSH
jgi:phosphatidylglycerol lysyltransferase